MQLKFVGIKEQMLCEDILNYKGKEFPNLSLLVGLVFTLSGSNPFERAITIFIMILLDNQLKTLYTVIEIKCN